MGTTADDARLDAMFAALADRTRRDIVARLSEGEATVKELAAPYAMSLQAVSQHIGVLERCGLVSRSRHRQTRPCRLEPRGAGDRGDVDRGEPAVVGRADGPAGAHLARLQDGEQR